ncbi:centriolar and ciliogenesis-associated protein HYLS1-like [Hydractinia symbiolongicarpus]|uniref:centriolar and ciliogenesis-associated protein HYLS1-like n=1 Tax=Hydractinia symbiolongicarpus TaxID=13093 RepID=UPI00254BBBC9|nr:centriolar and ciliogenesis-associated protein HYLS1-like [Hydractinia symbiolongicarpus]
MEFTRSEVREKLRDLGYVNVPESKLQEFMSDLKELIYHDQSSGVIDSDDGDETGHSLLERHHPDSRVLTSNLQRKAFSKTKISGDMSLTFDESKYSQNGSPMSDMSSTATSNKYLDSTLEEHKSSTFRRKVARKKNGQVHVFDETLTDNDSQASDITDLEEHLRGMPGSRDISTYAESSVSMVSSRSRKAPLPAFIRPSTAQPHTKGIRKCDPVSRYHQFKEEWKMNNVPGESKHSSLRWNIRGEMLNCEMFEKPHRRYTTNNYVVPTSKKRQALRWQVRTAMAKI